MWFTFLTLKMETAGSSKTMVNIHQTTHHHIPENYATFIAFSLDALPDYGHETWKGMTEDEEEGGVGGGEYKKRWRMKGRIKDEGEEKNYI
jgi:hypothetical protein